jgi:hypothetical protein
MEENSFRLIKFSVLLVVVLIVGLVFGSLMRSFFSRADVEGVSYQDGYRAGFDAAKKLVEKSSLGGMLRSNQDPRMLSGTVIAKGDTTLTIHTTSSDPFMDPSLSDRVVRVDASTKITRFIQKDPETYQKEVDAFMKAVQAGASSPMEQLTLFTQTGEDFKSIEAGDILVVMASQDIQSMKEFTVREIRIPVPGSLSPAK